MSQHCDGWPFLWEYFSALEVAFDYSKKTTLILLSDCQTPEAIRRTGTRPG